MNSEVPCLFNCNRKKVQRFNSGKFWDPICNMALQKMKIRICITKKLLVVWSRSLVAENIHLLEKKYHKFLSRKIQRCNRNTLSYSKKCFKSIPYFFEFLIIQFFWTISIFSLFSKDYKRLSSSTQNWDADVTKTLYLSHWKLH